LPHIGNLLANGLEGGAARRDAAHHWPDRHSRRLCGLCLRYHRCNAMLEEMAFAPADGSIKKLEAAIAKAQLLILDDFALAPSRPTMMPIMFSIVPTMASQAAGSQ
jgi:hypothetical protein